ncbi:Putative vacuolar membrane transporter for cationic amino acids [Rhodotorula toruloides]
MGAGMGFAPLDVVKLLPRATAEVAVGLSTLDLVSKLTGWLSCGPSLALLWLWLFGDIGQVVGMFLTGALLTQKFSGIWFFASDVILIMLTSIERGHFGKRFRRGNRVQSPVAGRKKRWWLEFDSWKVNVLVLATVVIGGTAAWLGIDYVRRDTEPPLEPSKAPHDTLSRTGWALGMLGLLCYNLPRIRQILLIRRQRTLGNISLYMYLWLIAQNITMLVSILAITPPGGSAALGHFFGQAPFLGNVLFALANDFIILRLYFRYDHGKPRPVPINNGSDGESDAADMAEAGLLSGDERSHSTSRPEERSRDRRARLEQLDKHHAESLRLESKRARGGAGQLPILARRRLAADLDRRAIEEDKHRHDFGESGSSHGSGSSGDEVGESRGRLRDKRRRLEDLRTSRRRSDARAEAAIDEELRTHPLHEHIDRRKAESSGRASSTEHEHKSSGSSDEAEHLRRPSQRSTRSIGKRVFHPRRGVGTDW